MPLREGRWRAVPAALLVLALWLLLRPWQGLWHDGRLYAVQALRRLEPGNFLHDLFFLFGSQDAFTAFTPLYAAAIAALGLDRAALLVQAAGSVLWLGAAAFLLARFLRGFAFWLALLLLVALPSDYGPLKGMFFLAEGFTTPRLFAEAFGMLAIAFAMRGRPLLAAAGVLLALLLHPLMAAGAALFCVLYLGRGHWRGLCALALGAGALLLLPAFLGLEPFDRLLRSMDAAWWSPVAELVPAVAWDSWQWQECASRWMLAFSLVLAAARLASGAQARFFCCSALVGAAGLLGSWLGTGLTHNLLMIQVQPWRALWLLMLASWVALAWLLAGYWQRGRVFRVLLLAFGAAIMTRNSFGGWLALAAAIALCQQAASPEPLQLNRRHYAMALAMVGVLASAWLVHAFDGGTGIYLGDFVLVDRDTLWLWALFKQGGAAALGTAALWLAWRGAGAAGRLPRCAAWAVGLASLGGALAVGVSSDRQSALMSPAGQQQVQQVFLPLIPSTASVYWQDDVRYTWFVLHRSSYASAPQLGGAAFNRGTALEGQRRLRRLQRLGGSDSVRGRDSMHNLMLTAALPAPGKDGLRYVCADPALDFVVLNQRFGQWPVAQVKDAEAGMAYFLYDCARLRAAADLP